MSSRTCFGIFMLILSKNEEPGRAASERRTALYRGGSTIWGRTVFHAYSGSSFFSAQRFLRTRSRTGALRDDTPKRHPDNAGQDLYLSRKMEQTIGAGQSLFSL
ncbi:hypothetical protein BG32_02505 [Mesotoga sp. HF07.pep.5.2.highcov]|nr:hypothetical protein BG32_02505 [Mesotoga sp. HF07.pep.5.2.highcov]